MGQRMEFNRRSFLIGLTAAGFLQHPLPPFEHLFRRLESNGIHGNDWHLFENHSVESSAWSASYDVGPYSHVVIKADIVGHEGPFWVEELYTYAELPPQSKKMAAKLELCQGFDTDAELSLLLMDQGRAAWNGTTGGAMLMQKNSIMIKSPTMARIGGIIVIREHRHGKRSYGFAA